MYVGDYSLKQTILQFQTFNFSYVMLILYPFGHWFRAGHKLEAAVEQLGVEVAGKVALDSGLSTGGFTDCLLQYGASFVYGVDVGYGQVQMIFTFVFTLCQELLYMTSNVYKE